MPADDTPEYGERTHVERTDVGVSITTKLQRGTGTNDRDTVEAKVKCETRAEAEDELEALRPALRKHLATVRGWQPSADADDGDGNGEGDR